MRASSIRDFQKNRVYDWEAVFVSKYDKSKVSFEQIQDIVNFVWVNEGLQYPPRVEALHKQDSHAGKANRMRLRFSKDGSTPTWVILHEIAHSMTSTFDGRSNFHGELFVGIYMKLLTRYIHISMDDLKNSVENGKIKFNLEATPVFLNQPCN